MKATKDELMDFFDYVVKRIGKPERFHREIVTDDFMKLKEKEIIKRSRKAYNN